jgi:aminoglycoside 6-adenylyltransferase
VTERVARFLADLERFAREQQDVRVAVVVGSQARADTPADEWSDVDVVLVVDDVGARLGDAAWLDVFGTPELTLLEGTPVGGLVERRVLYTDGLEVDFTLVPADAFGALQHDPAAARIRARGERIVYDELGLAPVADPGPPPPPEPAQLVHDFWYHALWAAKKLRRGEGITARGGVEYCKRLLLELARAHAQTRADAPDTWHSERFAEQWAHPRALAAIWADAAGPEELPGALRQVCDAFDALAAETFQPVAGVAEARTRLAALLGPTDLAG